MDARASLPTPWRRFVASFAAAAFLTAAVSYGTILAFDPYGLRAGPGRAVTPIMDLNQRFMYPQVVRAGRFDAAVFGTSTIRLLDPRTLDALFHARFANLGLNAGTPWEQTQLAELFLRHVPRPKAMIFGLDATWCEEDADGPQKRLTFRPFPPWLYEEPGIAAYIHLFTFKSLEIAGRLALHRLGLVPERIRDDGYEVFLPPEARYDLGRAREHIWGGAPRVVAPVEPAAQLSAGEAAALRFPALPWLERLLQLAPQSTAVTLVFTPVHVAAQPVPGSPAAAREAVCKARVAEIGRRQGAAVVDLRFPSPVTSEDSNYWDPLHYRLGIADRIAHALEQARTTGRDDPEGLYRVLTPPATR